MKLSGFQSTPSARRATFSLVALRIWSLHFNPRPPRGGRPSCTISSKPLLINFNPRPPRGGRPVMQDGLNRYVKFQSTPSARRATQSSCLVSLALQFQSTPSARRATRRIINQLRTIINFNPRPPRGGRPTRRAKKESQMFISIHALREEGDTARKTKSINLSQFQSTPSARRATIFSRPKRRKQSNFNPRPPRGGRLYVHRLYLSAIKFQSTPSARRATGRGLQSHSRGRYFNPRPPRGGRPATSLQVYSSPIFQSTPSARRATSCPWPTAAREAYFNPRPPRGGRPLQPNSINPNQQFQSTPSARRATGRQKLVPAVKFYFNPRPPRGGRRATAFPLTLPI